MFRFLVNSSEPEPTMGSIMLSSNVDGGTLKVDSKEDKAEICFTDDKKGETEKADLRLYRLSTLKRIVLDFSEPYDEKEDEVLVNTWQTRRVKGKVIKYASEKEVAFVLSAEKDADGFLNKLDQAGLPFNKIDYFKERQLCRLITSMTKLTMAEFRKIPGMDDERIKILASYCDSVVELIKRKISFQELGSLSIDLLKGLLGNSYVLRIILDSDISLEEMKQIQLTKLRQCLDDNSELKKALTFLTMKQILGLDDKSKDLDLASVTVKKSSIELSDFPEEEKGYLGMSKSDGKFAFFHRKNNIEINYAKSVFTLRSDELSDEAVSEYDEKIKNKKPREYVHRWYEVLDDNVKHKNGEVLYCPELKILHSESMDCDFPEDDFYGSDLALELRKLQFYKELNFEKVLTQFKMSLADFKNQPAMTKDKMALLVKYQDNLLRLSAIGIDFTLLLKVQLTRLECLLRKPADAKSALTFVDLNVLLDLKPKSSHQSQGFFDAPQSKVEEKQLEPVAAADSKNCSCAMM